MRPRASGGFEPDERDQHALSELWHLSRTALAGTGLDAREHRLQWAIDAFMKEHGTEPHVAHKWIYVWAVDNLGKLTTGQPRRTRAKKPRNPPRPRVDPVAYARRIQGGTAHASAAIGHLLEAQRHLNAACADLCSVVGGTAAWRALSKLSGSVDAERRSLEQAIFNSDVPLYLDHDPTENELLAPHRYGCGGIDPIAEAKRAKRTVPAPPEPEPDRTRDPRTEG